MTYTLSGRANPETGWGAHGRDLALPRRTRPRSAAKTGSASATATLATHVERTRRLRAGETLSRVTSDLSRRLGVPSRIAPMCDERVRTVVETSEGDLPFQEYFVRRACEPAVRGLRFEGAASARMSAAFASALADPALEAVVVCPSNPYLSVDPILAIPGVRGSLARCAAPVVAVSPIVGGRAIKGPAAKIMEELGVEASAAAVADRATRDLLDGFVLDETDRARSPARSSRRGPGGGCGCGVERTIMHTGEDRTRLAARVLELARTLREG